MWLVPCAGADSMTILNPSTPTDDLSHPNTMDGRVHSALKGLNMVSHFIQEINVYLRCEHPVELISILRRFWQLFARARILLSVMFRQPQTSMVRISLKYVETSNMDTSDIFGQLANTIVFNLGQFLTMYLMQLSLIWKRYKVIIHDKYLHIHVCCIAQENDFMLEHKIMDLEKLIYM